MDELPEGYQKTFYLKQEHINFLRKSDTNLNNALRKSLDRLIVEDSNHKKHKLLLNIKDNIIIISLGLLFILFGLTSLDLVVSSFMMAFGLFLMILGVSLGVMQHKI